MKEITFEINDGRFNVICRFDEENGVWSAVLLNTTTFKHSKLISGTIDQLPMLITILFELDKKSYKTEPSISDITQEIKRKWKDINKLNKKK